MEFSTTAADVTTFCKARAAEGRPCIEQYSLVLLGCAVEVTPHVALHPMYHELYILCNRKTLYLSHSPREHCGKSSGMALHQCMTPELAAFSYASRREYEVTRVSIKPSVLNTPLIPFPRPHCELAALHGDGHDLYFFFVAPTWRVRYHRSTNP